MDPLTDPATLPLMDTPSPPLGALSFLILLTNHFPIH